MADSAVNPLASLSEIAASLPRQPISSSSPIPAPTSIKPAPIAIKQRRLSSAGQSRRRHSDATAATLTNVVVSRVSASGTTALSAGVGIAPTHSRSRSSVSAHDEVLPSSLPPSTVIEHLKEPPPSIHTLKKKGQVFKCESCAKVYRHPSCLVKHRWEHSPHWHETSKLLLSKHQQVQLLEAAAILSHIAPPNPNAKPPAAPSEPSVPPTPAPTSGITTRTSAKLAAASVTTSSSPSSPAATADDGALHGFEEVASLSLGTSLPEDRSLWPFFVSRGAVVTSLSTANGTAQRSSKAEDSDGEVFEEDDDVEVEVVSSVSPLRDHDPERIDNKDDVDNEEREDSGYASSGGGLSVSANRTPSSQPVAPSQGVTTRSARARSHSTSTSASVSVTRGGSGLVSVPETNDPDEGKMCTRSRSRSNASNTARPSATATSSGLGATRPARLSSQPPSASSHAGHHRRSSSTGYHPYGSYRSSMTTALGSSAGTSFGGTGVNISGRPRSHSHSRGANGGTPSSATSAMSIPPPPPVPMLLGAGQRGVAIIDGSGSHHHPYTLGTASSYTSYGYPHGTGSGSFAGSGGIANPSSVSVSIPRSSIISNIRSLDEEDESIADADESIDNDSCAGGSGGATRALDLRSVGTSGVSELEEHDYERPASGKRYRDDDQETVDGSWDGEDDQACGMAMDMDL